MSNGKNPKPAETPDYSFPSLGRPFLERIQVNDLKAVVHQTVSMAQSGGGIVPSIQDEQPCCGCFGQSSPRAKSRPSTPRVDRPQAAKVKETEKPGGWTIGAELVGASDRNHLASSAPQQLDRLPSGADELHERTQRIDDVSPVHTPVAAPGHYQVMPTATRQQPDPAQNTAHSHQVPAWLLTSGSHSYQNGTGSQVMSSLVAAAEDKTDTSVYTSAPIHSTASGGDLANAAHNDTQGPAEGMSGTPQLDLCLSTHLAASTPEADLPLPAKASQRHLSEPMDGAASTAGTVQLDLDVPSQLAEPESQEGDQAVAPAVVRGRMVRSESHSQQKRLTHVAV